MPVIFKLASGENVPLDGGYVYSQTYIYILCMYSRTNLCGEGDIKERSSASISSFCYSAGDVHFYSSRQLTLQCVNGFT